MATFKTLPPEMLGTIAAHCDISSLQALRLTCSPMEEVFRTYTFQTVALSFNKFSHDPRNIRNVQAMKMLARPGNRISMHIRSLRLDSDELDTDLTSMATYMKPFTFLKKMTAGASQRAAYQSKIDKYAIPALISLTGLRHVEWFVSPYDIAFMHIIPIFQKVVHLDSFGICLGHFAFQGDGEAAAGAQTSMQYISSLRCIKSLRLIVDCSLPAVSTISKCLGRLLEEHPELRSLELSDIQSWKEDPVVRPSPSGYIRIISLKSSWRVEPGALRTFRDLRSLTFLKPQVIPWEEFTAVSVLLTHIRITSSTRAQLLSMLDYLESYCGLEVLNYKQMKHTDTATMAEAERFYMHALPQHATTVRELWIYSDNCYYSPLHNLPTPESFNNLSSYLQLQRLNISSARLREPDRMEWEALLIRSVPLSLRFLDINRHPESNQGPVEEFTPCCQRLEAALKRLSPLPHDQINTQLQITIRQTSVNGLGTSVMSIMELDKGWIYPLVSLQYQRI